MVWYDLADAGYADPGAADSFSLVNGQLRWGRAAYQFQDWMATSATAPR